MWPRRAYSPTPAKHDPAAFDALLTALAPSPAGEARHFVEHVYKRQDPQPDGLPDPYHRPRYSGWPEQVIQDNWARGEDTPSAVERAATTKGVDGTIYGRQYLGPNQCLVLRCADKSGRSLFRRIDRA